MVATEKKNSLSTSLLVSQFIHTATLPFIAFPSSDYDTSMVKGGPKKNLNHKKNMKKKTRTQTNANNQHSATKNATRSIHKKRMQMQHRV